MWLAMVTLRLGVIHAMEGMIPRFHRGVCAYFTAIEMTSTCAAKPPRRRAAWRTHAAQSFNHLVGAGE